MKKHLLAQMLFHRKECLDVTILDTPILTLKHTLRKDVINQTNFIGGKNHGFNRW